MNTDSYDTLKRLNYKAYRDAIMYSEVICLNLTNKLRDDVDKTKVFAKIESVIVGILLQEVAMKQ
jgi:hypothetical protein